MQLLDMQLHIDPNHMISPSEGRSNFFNILENTNQPDGTPYLIRSRDNHKGMVMLSEQRYHQLLNQTVHLTSTQIDVLNQKLTLLAQMQQPDKSTFYAIGAGPIQMMFKEFYASTNMVDNNTAGTMGVLLVMTLINNNQTVTIEKLHALTMKYDWKDFLVHVHNSLDVDLDESEQIQTIHQQMNDYVNIQLQQLQQMGDQKTIHEIYQGLQFKLSAKPSTMIGI